MKQLLAILAFTLVSAVPAPDARETEWSAWIAEQKDGVAEFVTPDGSRVDVLTGDVAYEVEWETKWAEAIGQSEFYAAATNRQPGIVLLLKGADERYYLRCLTVCSRLGIRLETVDTRNAEARDEGR